MRGDEGARRWGECLKVGKQALNVEAVIMNKETAQLMDEPNVTELHDTPTTTADEASSPDLFTALESAMILEKKKKRRNYGDRIDGSPQKLWKKSISKPVRST